MDIWTNINKSDRDVIVALPYRVGLWISQVDSSGGGDADLEEEQALESIIDGFTQDVFGSEVVQIIMTETMQRRQEWPEWQSNLNKVREECQNALDALNNAEIEEKEVSAYKQRLIEIAEAVALAFREYDDLSFTTKMRVYLLYYKERYKAARKDQSYKTLDQFLNISLKERRALYDLSHVLDVPYS